MSSPEPVLRLEDDGLLRGVRHYLADLHVDGMLHAVFVRSPVAHGRLRSVDATGATAAPGVVAVFTAADLGLGLLAAHPFLPERHDRPPLATEVVRHVGDPVAVVVADTVAHATDAAELVVVDVDELEPVVDLDRALAAEGPAFEHRSGDADEVLAGADVVVRSRFWNNRVATAPMEPDGALGVPEADGGLTVWCSTQTVHKVRDAIAASLEVDPGAVRVRAPHVGGGFGGKFEPSPETIVVAAVARRLGAPVRWVQTRTENLVGMPHGRAMRQDVALGLRADGRVTGLWAELVGDAGGHPMIGALMPNATLMMLPGTYRFERAGGVGRAASTTTTPLGAYRGAGRPEACALLERVLDIAARRLGMDPVELRRVNLVPPDAFPYTSATGMPYDSGNYRACLDGVVELLGYDELRAEQEARRAAGSRSLLGVGVAMWIDCTPMNRPGEYARVELDTDGGGGVRAVVRDGANDQGQAHRSTWALLLHRVLGVPLECVDLELGDTARVPHGLGTGSARSLMLAGGAVDQAGHEVLATARQIAAGLLEAAPADVVVTAEGRLGVVGTLSRSVSWAEVIDAAGAPLVAAVDFEQSGPTFPAGCHGAVVSVDADTGAVTLERFVAVDDCGVAINPAVVTGQQHGGMVQGIAQALYEEIVYDEWANPLTANFATYSIPSSAEVPSIEAHRIETPSPVNPLGAKGIGQAGAIGSTPAVQNAVVDAVAHLGVTHIDLPLTPERVWRAISSATGPGAS